MTSLRERIVRTLLERAVQVGEVTVLDGGLVRAGQRVEPRLVYEAESGQAAAQQELPLQVMTGKAEMASPRFLEAPAAKLVAAQAADREEEARRAAQQVPAQMRAAAARFVWPRTVARLPEARLVRKAP